MLLVKYLRGCQAQCAPYSILLPLQINIIMKDVATLEARESATRAELDDERRMHDMTIRCTVCSVVCITTVV